MNYIFVRTKKRLSRDSFFWVMPSLGQHGYSWHECPAMPSLAQHGHSWHKEYPTMPFGITWAWLAQGMSNHAIFGTTRAWLTQGMFSHAIPRKLKCWEKVLPVPTCTYIGCHLYEVMCMSIPSVFLCWVDVKRFRGKSMNFGKP